MEPSEKRLRLRDFLLQLEVRSVRQSSDDHEVFASTGLPGAQQPFPDKAAEALSILLHSHDLDHDLGDEQVQVLEAIVLPQRRPVFDVRDDRFETPPPPYDHLGFGRIRAGLESAVRAVGRIELSGVPEIPYAGTGFLVGNDILMTNRHVAELFASGCGLSLRFRPGFSPSVDFKHEIQSSATSAFPIRSVLMIHPYWDVALLRVDGVEARSPLQLSTEDPARLFGHEVVVIGYPALDDRNDLALQHHVFRGEFGVKRLQPGRITGRRTVSSYGNLVSALSHDCSTLGGNSGSAVIEIGTGKVVGVHFAGSYLVANYAVPMYELARDGRLLDVGLAFSGSAQGRSEHCAAAWAAVEPEST